MAVLVEAYSVIIKRDAIASRFLGGWEAFVGIIPNQTACTDGQLVRVGFMSLSDAEYYIDLLKNNGLIYKEEDKFIHIALVLQGKASLALSDWLSVSTIPADGGTVSVCWLGAGITGQEGVVLIPSNMDLATPIKWK